MMISGLCGRVLLLFLLATGPYAQAFSCRREGPSGVEPSFEPNLHEPALASSSHGSSGQPGGFLGSFDPRYPQSGSTAERVVPSQHRETPQHLSHQDIPTENGVQWLEGLWDCLLPRNRFQVTSNYGLETHSDRQSEARPRLQEPPEIPSSNPQRPDFGMKVFVDSQEGLDEAGSSGPAYGPGWQQQPAPVYNRI